MKTNPTDINSRFLLLDSRSFLKSSYFLSNRQKIIVWYHVMMIFLIILIIFSTIIQLWSHNDSSVYADDPSKDPSHPADFVYQNLVQLPDSSLEMITILFGQEPADVVYRFGLNHGLDQSQREHILGEVCSTLERTIGHNILCTRDKAVIFSTSVSSENSFIGQFDLYEGIEPVDAVHEFVINNNLDIGYRNAVLKEVCEHVDCHRLLPMVWKYTVWVQEPVTSDDGHVQKTPVYIELLEDQELADIIYHSLLPWKITRTQRRNILDIAKSQGVPSNRDDALVYRRNILVNETGYSWNATLTIWDDGIEPVDSVYHFFQAQTTNLYSKEISRDMMDSQWQLVSDSILPQLCSIATCKRMQPLIWSYPITSNTDQSPLAILEIMRNEEPIDAIDRFTTFHQLGTNYRHHLLNIACKDLPCRRNIPVVFQKTVQDEQGRTIGIVKVMENEEVVDAVVRFMRGVDHKYHIDPIVMKNSFFQIACTNNRVLCTRNVAHIFDKPILNHDGSIKIGQLTITEFEEPADKIYQWIQNYNLSLSYFDSIIEQVCTTDGIICTRKKPVIFRLPLRDPNGNYIGQLEIQRDEEPVDSVYKFFARYRLFEKNWDLKAVVQQVCKISNIPCHRDVAIKFFSGNFEMGDDKRNVGPFIVWEFEEVIDKLYEKRMEYNLTLDDQMKSFSSICHSKDVYCGRTRAVVYKMTGITKRDYEKYGNETCLRKYAGWQYLASLSGSLIGSQIIRIMKQPYVALAISHPLFSPCALFLIMTAAYFFLRVANLWSARGIKQQQKRVYQSLSFLFVLLTMSIFHASVIEPENAIDNAMHIYEGKLPDLIILEGEEPVDVLLKWGKQAAKDHHPIVREPIYWDILQTVCSQIQPHSCRRKRAWHSIDMGTMTVSDQPYEITYLDRSVDPHSRNQCHRKDNELYDSCIQDGARDVCMRIHPQPSDCLRSISAHISQQLRDYRKKRFDSKDTYVKLGLEMDCSDEEIYYKLASVVRSRGMNLPPFQRVDNGTTAFYKWDLPFREASIALDSFQKIKDPESRIWNDKPCTPYFGGALCAKTDKDGNMIIEV